MKKTILEIFNAVLTIIVCILLLIIQPSRKMWLKISRHILRPYFGFETKAYKKWHDNRAFLIQKLLDKEHEVRFNTISAV